MRLKNLRLPAFVSLCCLFALFDSASAQIATSWKQTGAPSLVWSAVASSADGTKLVAAQPIGHVYVSTNSGITWTPTTLQITNHWSGHTVASSADGTRLAVSDVNAIYVSTDSGATWTPHASAQDWAGIASTPDGSKLAAVGFNSQIYISTNAGTNWTASGPVEGWIDVACSADGTRLVAAAYQDENGDPGSVFISTDSGAHWNPVANMDQSWTSVSSSADGTVLVAANTVDVNLGNDSGEIYISTNSGANWTAVYSWTAPALNWECVASSADGTRLVAVAEGIPGNFVPGLIYTSTNSGTSWQLSYAPDSFWLSVASSADGNQLVAANGLGGGGGVFTFAAPPANAPTLGLALSGGNNLLSWPWPSYGFALQQNSNLASTNWVTVTNTPAVMNQVIVAPANANNFYRLVEP